MYIWHVYVWQDKVMCYAVPKFGVHHWELSPTQRPLLEHTAIHTYKLAAAESKDTTKGAGSPNLVVGFRREDEAFRSGSLIVILFKAREHCMYLCMMYMYVCMYVCVFAYVCMYVCI